ncbi:MAG: nucleoside transporter C-terminal domain-containing protein [Pseudomonadota bacterium]
MDATLPAQSLIAIVAIPFIAFAISEDRRAMSASQILWLIAGGLALQYALVIMLLAMPWTRGLFDALGGAVLALQNATDAGSQLLFGYLAGADAPFEVTKPQFAYIVAFRVFPMILVLSALVRLLYHWGILQRVVQAFAWALQRTFGTGGPLSTGAAASVFLGLVEAPLVIRPYLSDMGRGALFATMVCTMATVSGTVMALYAGILSAVVPGSAGHIVAASLINVPAALMLARLAIPTDFTGGPSGLDVHIEDPPRSSVDAVVQGTMDGIGLVAGVAAMLIVMISLVALVNGMLGAIGPVGDAPLTLQRMLGVVCAPIAFAIGIPWSEAATAGSLIGQKVILNEFFAYLQLVELGKSDPGALSERSRLLLTYALCGFANLGSLGILIGGLSAMAQERRPEIVALAPRAMLVGFLATMLSAAVVGTTTWSVPS